MKSGQLWPGELRAGCTATVSSSVGGRVGGRRGTRVGLQASKEGSTERQGSQLTSAAAPSWPRCPAACRSSPAPSAAGRRATAQPGGATAAAPATAVCGYAWRTRARCCAGWQRRPPAERCGRRTCMNLTPRRRISSCVSRCSSVHSTSSSLSTCSSARGGGEQPRMCAGVGTHLHRDSRPAAARPARAAQHARTHAPAKSRRRGRRAQSH